MDSFFQEWWRGNIVSRRPSVGYNTKEERQDNVLKGISDYEVYYKNELIGEVYKKAYIDLEMVTKFYWKYTSLDGTIDSATYEKGIAVTKLYEAFRKQRMEEQNEFSLQKV